MRFKQFLTLAGDYLEEDDPIIMIDHTGHEFRGHVAGLDENKFPLIWISGCTSWSLIDHPKKHFIPSGGWYAYRFYDDPVIKLNAGKTSTDKE